MNLEEECPNSKNSERGFCDFKCKLCGGRGEVLTEIGKEILKLVTSRVYITHSDGERLEYES